MTGGTFEINFEIADLKSSMKVLQGFKISVTADPQDSRSLTVFKSDGFTLMR